MVSSENTADEPCAPGLEGFAELVHLGQRQILRPVSFMAVRPRFPRDMACQERERQPIGVGKILDAEKGFHFDLDASFFERLAHGRVSWGLAVVHDTPWDTPLTFKGMTRRLADPENASILATHDSAHANDARWELAGLLRP
jgi:hypothetical protein